MEVKFFLKPIVCKKSKTPKQICLLTLVHYLKPTIMRKHKNIKFLSKQQQ